MLAHLKINWMMVWNNIQLKDQSVEFIWFCHPIQKAQTSNLKYLGFKLSWGLLEQVPSQIFVAPDVKFGILCCVLHMKVQVWIGSVYSSAICVFHHLSKLALPFLSAVSFFLSVSSTHLLLEVSLVSSAWHLNTRVFLHIKMLSDFRSYFLYFVSICMKTKNANRPNYPP